MDSLPQHIANGPRAQATKCLAYYSLGDSEAVSRQLQALRDSERADPQQIAACEAYWYQIRGDHDAALASYHRREALIGEGGNYYVLGFQTVRLGEIERAMDWFELALEKRDWRIIYIRTSFRDHAELKANARFQALLRKMHLDDESLRQMGYL